MAAIHEKRQKNWILRYLCSIQSSIFYSKAWNYTAVLLKEENCLLKPKSSSNISALQLEQRQVTLFQSICKNLIRWTTAGNNYICPTYSYWVFEYLCVWSYAACRTRADMEETKRLPALWSAKPLPAAFAISEPSLLMTTSELLIMRKLCPDRILPNRSGTGAPSASWSGLKAGTLLLHVQRGYISFTLTALVLYTHITSKRNQNQCHKQRSAREVHFSFVFTRASQSPFSLWQRGEASTDFLQEHNRIGKHVIIPETLPCSLCYVSRFTFQCILEAFLRHKPLFRLTPLSDKTDAAWTSI